MPLSVDISQAKTMLSQLVDAAQAGHEVVIIRRGQPVARLQPFSSLLPRQSLFGCCAGQIEIADDFDELPEDIARAFGAID
jgi:prevent-host-death family protein